MRKSQPLTKELAQKIFDILKEPNDNIAKHLKIALFVKYEIIKPRVEWLLKEIEKEQKRDWVWIGNEKSYNEDIVFGYKGCLERMKEIIKKSFSGVIDDV